MTNGDLTEGVFKTSNLILEELTRILKSQKDETILQLSSFSPSDKVQYLSGKLAQIDETLRQFEVLKRDAFKALNEFEKRVDEEFISVLDETYS